MLTIIPPRRDERHTLSLLARVDQVSSYVDRVFALLPRAMDCTPHRVAVAEALLNAVLHGALGLRGGEAERDAVDYLDEVRAAEQLDQPPSRIAVHVEQHAGGDVSIRVTDPGPGFDWRRLVQADNQPLEPNLTCGRGLSLIRAGSRAVHWNDAGNALTMTLTLKRDQARTSSAPPPSERDTTDPAPRRKSAMPVRPRVLVADDDSLVRQVIERILTTGGFEVTAVEDGVAALAALEAGEYDVALLDVEMPLLGGLDTVRAVRERNARCSAALILMTVGSNEVPRALGIEAGAWDFLYKPIGGRELLASVRRAVEVRTGLKELTDANEELWTSIQELADSIAALQPAPEVVCEGATVESLVLPQRWAGGDAVDVFATQGQAWALTLIDVAGHGVATTLAVSASRAILRDRLRAGHGALEAVVALDRHLSADFDCTARHAAIAIVRVDPEIGEIEILNAGCPDLVVRRRDGVVETVRSGGPPAGLLPGALWQRHIYKMADVAWIAIASDGVTEAVSSSVSKSALLSLCADLGLDDDTSMPRDALLRRLGGHLELRDDASLAWIRFCNQAPSSSQTARR